MKTKLILGLFLSLLIKNSLIIAGGFNKLSDMPKDTRDQQTGTMTSSYEEKKAILLLGFRFEIEAVSEKILQEDSLAISQPAQKKMKEEFPDNHISPISDDQEVLLPFKCDSEGCAFAASNFRLLAFHKDNHDKIKKHKAEANQPYPGEIRCLTTGIYKRGNLLKLNNQKNLYEINDQNAITSLVCDQKKCTFIAYDKKGLKIHTSKKHNTIKYINHQND